MSGPASRRRWKKAGIESVWIDRDRKPEYIEDRDGRLEEWGAFEGVKNHPEPDKIRAVGDPGGVGREPLVRILAEDLGQLRETLERILEIMDD